MTKEDFSLKKDVLQIQKKVADMELVSTELKEAMGKFDAGALDELKQRVEDVEDLAMVENAAVIELKKMLEGTTKPEQSQEIISPQLEERLNSIEQKILNIKVPSIDEIKSSVSSDIPATPAIDMTKFEETINEIKSSFDALQTDLSGRISNFEERLSQMKNTLTYLPDFHTLKTDLKNEILSSIPDYSLVRSDMQSTIETFKSELATEKGKIEIALEMVKNQIEKPLNERAIEELGKIKNDWLVNNSKVEAVQKFVENFSNELNNLKPVLAKLETFDRLLNLHEEISDKLQSFKEFQDNIQDAVEKNEDVEKRIQREVNKLKETGKEISKIEETLSKLTKEVDKIKKDEEKALGDVNIKFKEIVDPLKDRIDSIQNNLKEYQDVAISLDKRFGSVKKMIATVQDDMSVFQGSLMPLEQSRLDLIASVADLQETKGSFDKRLELLHKELSKLSSETKQKQEDVASLTASLTNLQETKSTIEENFASNESIIGSLRSDFNKLKNELMDTIKKQPQNVSELTNRVGSLEAEVESIKSLEPRDNTNELVNKINELENRIESIRASTAFDEQMSEVVSRLVFLDSRIVAVEGMLQDLPRYSPIVVE